MIQRSFDISKLIFKKKHKKKSYKGFKGKFLTIYRFGLRTKKDYYLNFSHYEATRRVLVRSLKPKEVKNKKNLKYIRSAFKQKTRKRSKKQILRFRINVSLGLTKKPLQVRMGKGKGNPYLWVSPTPGRRFVIEYCPLKIKRRRLKYLWARAIKKFPVKLSYFFFSKYFDLKSFFKKSKRIYKKKKFKKKIDFKFFNERFSLIPFHKKNLNFIKKEYKININYKNDYR